MSRSSSVLKGCIVAVLAFLAFAVIAYILNGLALMNLWAWFVVPVLDVRPLSLVEAIGFGIVVSFLTKQHVDTRDDEAIIAIAYTVLSPLLALGIGYIVHLFL
jgi:hypothetical protein